MGAVIGAKYDVDTSELTDAGVQRDGNGNIIDPKELLKCGLINQWGKTKAIYEELSAEHKARFEELTRIDDVDFEDDNQAAARTFIDSIPNNDEAARIFDELK